jgi:membrane protease YdiL (CAAX protease family)
VLFGVVHLNPWQFVSAFVIGVFSGWVYYKTRKLTLSIMIHLTNNLFAFGSGYFMDAAAKMDTSMAQFYGGTLNFIAFTSGAILVAVVCLYWLRSEFRHTEMSYADAQDQD